MRKSRKPLVSVSALALFTVVVVACSAKKPNPPITPTTPVDAGSDAAVADAAPVGVAPPPDAGPVVSNPFFTDAGSSGGTTAPPALTEQAIDAAIDLAMTTAAPKLAPKMEKEGTASRQTMKEGDHFSMMITLAPNRCYTIVGLSLPGSVSQLDMKLYGPPLFNVEAGKSAAADKANPVIGKGTLALCPLLPIAVPYKLDAVATKGAGRVGIQVYARNK